MDKETQRNFILAMLLCIAIWVLWSIYLGPDPERQPERRAGSTPEVADEELRYDDTEVVPMRAPTPTAPSADLSVDAEEAPRERLDNEFLSATFTSLGGRLQSLTLREYDSKGGDGAVELVPSGDGELPLGIAFADEKLGDVLDRVVFSIESYSDEVTFRSNLSDDLEVSKTFRLQPGRYAIDAEIGFKNTGSVPLALGKGGGYSYALSWAPGVQRAELREDKYLGAVAFVNGALEERRSGKFKKDANGKPYLNTLSWLGLKTKYFFIAMKPEADLWGGVVAPIEIESELGEGDSPRFDETKLRCSLRVNSFVLQPGEQVVHRFLVCTSAMDRRVLEPMGEGFEKVVYFGFWDPICKLMLWLLNFFDRYLHNYGIAIILVTFLVRILLFPLNQKSYRAMKDMQKFQPELTELREKYKENPQEMNKKMMEFYREHKINPMRGCWPMAAQFPVMIGLFYMLRTAIELRGAPFIWIKDLSEPDTIAHLPFTLPFLGNNVNILPVFMIVSMVVQQKMTTSAQGPAMTETQQSQQKMMAFLPIVFGVMFYNLPSGLVLYWFLSNVLSIGQQFFTMKLKPGGNDQ